MPIRVYDYDYRTDLANLVVHPEIRGRFMRMEPGPATRRHSHDLGGEIFLVLEGHCEFLVEDERVTCGPGQLIYVEPRLRHTLHAVGEVPCVVYLSVTPHVEPTHTQYDQDGQRQLPRYGTWRGSGHGDPHPDRSTTELARCYVEAADKLAALAQETLLEARQRQQALNQAVEAGEQPALKAEMDALWLRLREVLQQVSVLETAWNTLAPRAMPEK